MHWPAVVNCMSSIITRSQIPKFETEIKRLDFIKVEQTNNLTDHYQQHIVYQPEIYQFKMDEKLTISLLSNSSDKLPKFSGKNSENVVRWLTKVTNELNVFKLTDAQKLLMVPSVLLDDARQWYVNNLDIIIDWATFSREIQKAFSSPVHRNLAIKQIGNRVQGMEESVLHYYHEVMELCDMIDQEMKDELKVGYLLAGVKLSLQKEVMRKNPKTPKEFLTVAQEEEKLDLSINIQMNHDLTSTIDSLSAIKSGNKSSLPYKPMNTQRPIRCFNCRKIGHIARNCYSKNF